MYIGKYMYATFMDPTVDGRNPAPVDMVNILLFTGFYTSQVVVWDFWTINSMGLENLASPKSLA